jgi:hypothetical protein
MRLISSGSEAPASALSVFPVCLRSWTCVSVGRPALTRALAHGLEKLLRRSWPPLDFHEDEAFWPWSGERLQVADPVGDDQLGQHHLADTRLGLWLAFTSRSSS